MGFLYPTQTFPLFILSVTALNIPVGHRHADRLRDCLPIVLQISSKNEGLTRGWCVHRPHRATPAPNQQVRTRSPIAGGRDGGAGGHPPAVVLLLGGRALVGGGGGPANGDGIVHGAVVVALHVQISVTRVRQLQLQGMARIQTARPGTNTQKVHRSCSQEVHSDNAEDQACTDYARKEVHNDKAGGQTCFYTTPSCRCAKWHSSASRLGLQCLGQRTTGLPGTSERGE